MTAGLYLEGKVWRFSYPADDSVGGSVPSGTVLYNPVFIRINSKEPTQALLEQGLETPEIFRAVIMNPLVGMVIRHNDQFEVTNPSISIHKGKKFVIIGIQYSSLDDPRRTISLTMRRFEIAHANNLQ
jgi:hypothetical protein